MYFGGIGLKKTLALFSLALALLLLFQPAAFALTKDGDGYYLIGTKEDWKEFAKAVSDTPASRDANARLAADIDFGEAVITDWAENYMIGKSENAPYKGKFDGNGKTVTLKIERTELGRYLAPFGCVSGDASEVKKLTVAGSVKSVENYVGGIAGYVSGGKISDCVNNASVEGNQRVGGVVGYLDGGSISNCSNGGKISVGAECAGGIAGKAMNGSSLERCANSGEVSGTTYIGGVAGYVENDNTLTNCTNGGAVSGDSYVGGVAGYVENDNTLTNCTNCGAVSGDSYIGGVAGTVGNSSVNGCANAGVVWAEYQGVGGIAGRVESCTAFANCTNRSEISGSSSIGGIAGSIEYTAVESCVNAGKVSGRYGYAAGVAGNVINCNFNNCINKGAVSAEGNIGGVAGYFQNGAIENCVNSASVIASEDMAGGVAGTALGADLRRCANCGDVSAANKAGGITGGVYANIDIENCSSTGKVEVSGEAAGGIAGVKKTNVNFENCNWLKVSGGAQHAVGKDEDLYPQEPSDPEGTVSADRAGEIPVAAVELDSYVKKGDSFSLTVTVYPPESNQASGITLETPAGLSLAPSSGLTNGAAADITVTAGTAGTEYTAKAKCGAAFANFSVTPETSSIAEVESVAFEASSYALNGEGKTTVKANVTPADATNKKLTLTPAAGLTLDKTEITADGNPAVITVTHRDNPALDYEVTAKSHNGKTARFTVLGTEIPATAITLDKSEYEVDSDGYITLKATLKPLGTTDRLVTLLPADGLEFQSSVIAAGAPVKVKVKRRVNPGQDYTATARVRDGVTATFTVKGTSVYVTGVAVDKTEVSGDIFTITATIEPADATLRKATLEPEAGLTLSRTELDSGEAAEITVTGRADDTKNYKVKVKAGDKSTEFTVLKKRTAVTGVTVDKTEVGGDTFTITATIEPADATLRKAILEPEAGLTLSRTELNSGEAAEITVTGRADDTKSYKVKVRAEDKSTEFTVLKKRTAVTSLTLDKEEVSGDRFKLTAAILPADSTVRSAIIKSPAGLSLNKTVLPDGEEVEITVLSRDSDTRDYEVKVTAEEHEATFKLLKLRTPVESLELDKYEVSGDTFELTAAILPSNSTVRAAAIECPEGLSLDKTVLPDGEATQITVAGREDSTIDYKVKVKAGGVTTEFKVKRLEEPEIPVEDINFDTAEVTVDANGNITITPAVTPPNATVASIPLTAEDGLTLSSYMLKVGEANVIRVTRDDETKDYTVTAEINGVVETFTVKAGTKPAPHKGGGGGGGGCSAGFAGLALLSLIPLALRRKGSRDR
jgi:Synergist-CTERM protein sorting domain-containing protein